MPRDTCEACKGSGQVINQEHELSQGLEVCLMKGERLTAHEREGLELLRDPRSAEQGITGYLNWIPDRQVWMHRDRARPEREEVDLPEGHALAPGLGEFFPKPAPAPAAQPVPEDGHPTNAREAALRAFRRFWVSEVDMDGPGEERERVFLDRYDAERHLWEAPAAQPESSEQKLLDWLLRLRNSVEDLKKPFWPGAKRLRERILQQIDRQAQSLAGLETRATCPTCNGTGKDDWDGSGFPEDCCRCESRGWVNQVEAAARRLRS